MRHCARAKIGCIHRAFAPGGCQALALLVLWRRSGCSANSLSCGDAPCGYPTARESSQSTAAGSHAHQRGRSRTIWWLVLFVGIFGSVPAGTRALTRMRGNLQANFDQGRRARTEVEIGRAARWTTTRCKTTMFLRVEMWYSSPGAPSSAARVILLHRVSWVSRAPSRQDAVTSRAHIRLGSLQGCSGKCNALLCHLCLFAAAAPCEELAAHVVLLKRAARCWQRMWCC